MITYINQIARESSDKQHLAVLLGRFDSNDKSGVVFIDGALEAHNVIVQEDQIEFTSEIWTKLYDSIGQYFHNTQIVGWFLTRPGKSLGINDKITKLHVDNFPGENKALFIVDPVDHEDAFYIYQEGRLVRQEGYYIYYERNEDMQNYMVDHRSTKTSEKPENNGFMKKREEILEKRQEKKDKERRSLRADALQGLKRASSLVVTFCILFALIFGFSQLNSKDSMEAGDNSQDGVIPVNVASGNVKTQDETEANWSDNKKDGADGENTADNDKDGAGGENTADGAKAGGTADAGTQVDETEDGAKVSETKDRTQVSDNEDNTASKEVPVQNVIRQYEVRDGDTLAGISQRFYNSYKYIEVIQEMNQIEDADKIYPGMTLNLP